MLDLPPSPAAAMSPRTMPTSSSNRRSRCRHPPLHLHPSLATHPPKNECPSKRPRDAHMLSPSPQIRLPASPANITPPLPLSPSASSPSSPALSSSPPHSSLPSPVLTVIHKRHRANSICRPTLSQHQQQQQQKQKQHQQQQTHHQRGPGPPSFGHIIPLVCNSSSSTLSSSSFATVSSLTTATTTVTTNTTTTPTNSSNYPVGLPDEVLVSIFRFIDHASKLAGLRTVCKQWCKVIDDTPDVWRVVSFKNTDFSPSVIPSKTGGLTLGTRPGKNAVSTAARSGNEWARFLKKIMFDREILRAVTTAQPIASLLVSGERPLHTRPFPPWVDDHRRGSEGTWVAIHAARRAGDGPTVEDETDGMGDGFGAHGMAYDSQICAALGGVDVASLPRGAMVGMIHVRDAVQIVATDANRAAPNWIWKIDRAVSLKKPIRCAGFVGLWSISGFLTDLLVNAMHRQ